MISTKCKFCCQTIALSLFFLAGNSLIIDSDRSVSKSRVLASEDFNMVLAQNKSDHDIDSIENLLLESIQGYKKEDINLVMNSIHPSSPVRANTKLLSEYSFEMYDLNYELNNFEIIKISESEAVVRITQTTKKISGPEFKNNRATSVQTLKKHNGNWKFFNFLGIENVQYLH